MNVKDLIEELSKLPPLQPVKIVVRGGAYRNDDGEDWEVICDAEGELQDVSFQGNHIRLETGQ